MEHDARLALVLVGPCMHVLGSVTMVIALGHCGLSGCRAQSDKGCNKSQTADHIATGDHFAAPVAKMELAAVQQALCRTQNRRASAARSQRTGGLGSRAQD